MTRVTWPITVGAVLCFLYAAAFLAYSLAAYFVGDAKLSAARALVGAFVAFICGILGTALLRAKDGNTGWLLWTGGAAGALAGMSTGWLGTVLFLLPMAFGLWGLLQTQHGS